MKLNRMDRDTIHAFVTKHAGRSGHIESDGHTLFTTWGEEIAYWDAHGKLIYVSTTSRSGRTIQDALRDEVTLRNKNLSRG